MIYEFATDTINAVYPDFNLFDGTKSGRPLFVFCFKMTLILQKGSRKFVR